MSDPELTPQQEEHVRRLLAEARHDEPVPAEVVDRLDRVLADLPRDRPGTGGLAPVIDLAARRRRRNAAALLAAAAAVIVAGFAIGQVIDVGASSDDDSAGGGSAAAPADRDAEKQELGSGDDSATATDGGADEVPSEASGSGNPVPLRLTSSNLEQDLTRQLKRYTSSHSDAPAAPGAFAAVGCEPGAAGKYGLGELFPALYDGEPAVLVLRPAAGQTQRADVLACGTATELDSATVPLR